MPRMARLESPGALVHIMAHSIENTRLFIDCQDREEFLSRLRVLLQATKHKCFAWTLMDTHCHLFLRSNDQPLSRLMRPLNGGYARWFNEKHSRRGYLFQDRYKSVLCQDQDYARQIIRYIHLNPVRAGLVKTIDELIAWKWCGHGCLTGKNSGTGLGLEILDRNGALRRFGASEREAVANYAEFMEQGINPGHPEHAGALPAGDSLEEEGSKKGWPAVIGDPDFVREAMARHQIGRKRLHRKIDYLLVLEKIMRDTEKAYGLESEEWRRRGRENNRAMARAHFCWRAYNDELIPMAVIARFLNITVQGVAKLLQGKRNAKKKR